MFQRPRRDEDDGCTYFFQPGQKADELDHISETLLGPKRQLFSPLRPVLSIPECGDLGLRMAPRDGRASKSSQALAYPSKAGGS